MLTTFADFLLLESTKQLKEIIKKWNEISLYELNPEELEKMIIDYENKYHDNNHEMIAMYYYFENGKQADEKDVKKIVKIMKKNKDSYQDVVAIGTKEYLNINSNIKIKEDKIDPKSLSFLKLVKSYPEFNIDIYDILDDGIDTINIQKQLRKLLDTHLGEDTNPWCLLESNVKNGISDKAIEYWQHYNFYSKQIAFRNGTVCAFHASDNDEYTWWSLQDDGLLGIRVKTNDDDVLKTQLFVPLFKEHLNKIRSRVYNKYDSSNIKMYDDYMLVDEYQFKFEQEGDKITIDDKYILHYDKNEKQCIFYTSEISIDEDDDIVERFVNALSSLKNKGIDISRIKLIDDDDKHKDNFLVEYVLAVTDLKELTLVNYKQDVTFVDIKNNIKYHILYDEEPKEPCLTLSFGESDKTNVYLENCYLDSVIFGKNDLPLETLENIFSQRINRISVFDSHNQIIDYLNNHHDIKGVKRIGFYRPCERMVNNKKVLKVIYG